MLRAFHGVFTLSLPKISGFVPHDRYAGLLLPNNNLRMKDGDLVTENLNAFNIVVSQLLSIDIKILDEDKCINLLCSLPDSWDILVVTIGSNATAL